MSDAIKPGIYWGWWDPDSEAVAVTVWHGGSATVFAYDNPMPEIDHPSFPPADWHHLEPIENPGRLK